MAKNSHKVPKKQWRRWSPVAQGTFNRVYRLMSQVNMYLHPKAPKPKFSHWQTVRWNAAWTAAQVADRKW